MLLTLWEQVVVWLMMAPMCGPAAPVVGIAGIAYGMVTYGNSENQDKLDQDAATQKINARKAEHANKVAEAEEKYQTSVDEYNSKLNNKIQAERTHGGRKDARKYRKT